MKNFWLVISVLAIALSAAAMGYGLAGQQRTLREEYINTCKANNGSPVFNGSFWECLPRIIKNEPSKATIVTFVTNAE